MNCNSLRLKSLSILFFYVFEKLLYNMVTIMVPLGEEHGAKFIWQKA